MSRPPLHPLAYPAAILVAVAIAVVRREPEWCSLAGALGLGAGVLRARAWRSARGGLAVANILTIVRLVVVVALGAIFAAVPRSMFVALVVSLLVLDGIDGHVARSRGESTSFGATLDMETDALTVMVLTLLLHLRASIGPWVLVAGLWRYAFTFAVAFAPALGDVPPSRLYRSICGVLMLLLAGAFLPWSAVAQASAAIGTGLLSFSFAHSIVRSRAFRGLLKEGTLEDGPLKERAEP